MVEAADKRVVETEVEVVEVRLSVPFLPGEQVVDDRRILGPAYQFPIRQTIVSRHAFEDQPRRSRVIGYNVVIVAVADKTDEAAGVVNIKGPCLHQWKRRADEEVFVDARLVVTI